MDLSLKEVCSKIEENISDLFELEGDKLIERIIILSNFMKVDYLIKRVIKEKNLSNIQLIKLSMLVPFEVIHDVLVEKCIDVSIYQMLLKYGNGGLRLFLGILLGIEQKNIYSSFTYEEYTRDNMFEKIKADIENIKTYIYGELAYIFVKLGFIKGRFNFKEFDVDLAEEILYEIILVLKIDNNLDKDGKIYIYYNDGIWKTLRVDTVVSTTKLLRTDANNNESEVA